MTEDFVSSLCFFCIDKHMRHNANKVTERESCKQFALFVDNKHVR